MNNKNKMYEFEKIAIIAVIVMFALIVGLVLFATRDSERPSTDTSSVGQLTDSEDATGDPDGVLSGVPSVVPEKDIQFTEVEIENSGLNEGALILVNQDHKYTADISSSLENLYSYNQKAGNTTNWYGLVNVKQSLKKEALDALNDMYRDYYAALPQTNVTITKTFVDAATQQSEYDAAYENADASKRPYLQAGGCSEHQTGLAVNINAPDASLSWFVDNCWKYGFISRYPDGKESVTYVKDEKNHFRYVGVPHALYMKLNKLVLEEYMGLLETKTNTTRLKLDVGTSDKYETYACKAATGATTKIKVPAENSGWSYMVSGTNNGYFVITIYQLQD